MNNKMGTGDKVLDFGIIIAAIITFAKTADVFSYFAPESLSNIVGFDISYIYGLVTALLVEGVMLALHFNRRAHGYKPAELAKWSLLAISFLCQVFDGFIVTNTLANQSNELKFIFQYGVPGLPILIMLMIFAIGHLPEDGEQVTRLGWKHRLPNFRRLWNGEEGGNVSETTGNETSTTGKRLKKTTNWQSVRDNLQKSDLLFIAGGDVDAIMQKYDIVRKTAYNWKGYARKELEK